MTCSAGSDVEPTRGSTGLTSGIALSLWLAFTLISPPRICGQIELINPRVQSRGFAFDLNGLAPQTTNIIQGSSNLALWVNLGTNDGSSAAFFDPQASDSLWGFYRTAASGPPGNPTNFTWTDVLNLLTISTNGLVSEASLQSATDTLLSNLVGSVPYARGALSGVERVRDIPAGNVTNSYTDVYQRTFGQEYLWHWFEGLTQQSTNIVAVFSGDSTTAVPNPGVSDPSFVPSGIFQSLAWLGGFPQVKTVNDGVSGQTMKFWSTNVVFRDIAANPDLLVLRWGLNDVPTPGQDFQTAVTAFENAMTNGLATFRASMPNSSILLMSPNSAADTLYTYQNEGWIESLIPALKRAARAYNCAFFDTYSFWQDSRSPQATNYMDSLHVHPQANLNLLIASEVWRVCFPESLVKSYGVSQFYNSFSSNVRPSASLSQPSGYPYGISLERAVPQGGWPIDGEVTTFRSADGICWQLVSGYLAADAANVQFRIGFTGALPGSLSNAWGPFISLGGTSASPSSLSKTAPLRLTTTSRLSFNLTSAAPTQDAMVALAGASPGDVVSLGIPNSSMPPNVGFNAWVSGPGTVTVRAFCLQGGAIVPSGVFRILVTGY